MFGEIDHGQNERTGLVIEQMNAIYLSVYNYKYAQLFF